MTRGAWVPVVPRLPDGRIHGGRSEACLVERFASPRDAGMGTTNLLYPWTRPEGLRSTGRAPRRPPTFSGQPSGALIAKEGDLTPGLLASCAPAENSLRSWRLRLQSTRFRIHQEGILSLVRKDLTPVYKETIGKGAGARDGSARSTSTPLRLATRPVRPGRTSRHGSPLRKPVTYPHLAKYMEENPLPARTAARAITLRKRVQPPVPRSAVSIHSLDRFLGDLANEKGWTIAPGPPTGKRVLVVGAGPAGLSCAYRLRRFSHDVESAMRTPSRAA